MTSELDLVRDRLERLQRIGAELNRARTIQDVTDIVMNVIDAPIHAPSRGLWLHEPGRNELELVAGAPGRTIEQFSHIPLASDLPAAIAHRERRTIVSTSKAEAEHEFADLRGATRSTDGFVAVPLVLEDTSLGVVGLGYDRALDDDDLGFLEAIAKQAAQTLARVRLAERDDRRREELEFLADLTAAALEADSYEQLMDNVTAAAVPTLGDWCSLYYMPEAGMSPHIAIAHTDPVKVSWVEEFHERYPFDPDSERGVASVIRSGETEFIPEITDALIQEAIAQANVEPAQILPVLDALNLKSAITVPLRTKRRVVGAIQFISAESARRYDEDDVSLAESVAARVAEALDSAWLSDQHRSIAVTLQRALLPPRLPKIPGIDLAARYWPAGAAEVGGDFYDVFSVFDGSWSVVIGDACGTGPNAAALTSIARHTVRAAARHGIAHNELMDWLNEAILLSDRDLFCTACYVTISRTADGWRLRSAAAGHPLPVLCTDGVATTIGRPGTLLGVFDDIRTTAAEVDLHQGDVVILYTDGISDVAPPHGLTPAEVLETVTPLCKLETADAIADAIHQSVLERVPEHHRQDDIAVVVLRVAD